MGKIFEIIRPKSLQNADYADFEYLIRWIGRDGADYLYMFYDAELNHSIRNEVINSENENNIKALISSESRTITLVASDLSTKDLRIILQLLSNEFVTRLLRNGSTERYAPDSNSKRYTLRDGRYDLEFKLIMPDLARYK